MSWRAFLLCRLLLFRNGVTRSRTGAARGLLVWWVLTWTFACLVFLLFRLVVLSADPAPARAVFALALDAAFAALIAFDLHFALATLLLDDDLSLLRLAPIPTSRLLLAKLLDSVPYTATLVIALAFPLSAAYIGGAPASLVGWALLPFLLLAFWLLAVGPGVLGLLVLVRWFPAHAVRDAIAVVGTSAFTLVWLGSGFVAPRLAEPGNPLLSAMGKATGGHRALAEMTPGHWLARALDGAVRGEWRDLALACAVLLGTAAAVTALAALVAGRALDSAQAAVQVREPRAAPPPRSGFLEPLRGPIAALAWKDLRIMGRELPRLGDVLVSALLWAALPLIGAPLLSGPPQITLAAAAVVLSGGLGYEVAARSIPAERSGFALLLCAPRPRAQWVRGKWAGSALLSGIVYVAAVALLALGLGVPAFAAVEAGAWGGLALLAALSMGVTLGVRFADFAWINPRAMLDARGRALAAAGLIAQAGAWIGLFWLTSASGAWAPWLRWPIGITAAALASAAALTMAARWLRSAEWLG